MAAERAECWNTHGAFGVAPDDLLAHLSSLNRDVSVRCETIGRDPARLRRSVLLFDSLSPWSRRGRLAELADQMDAIGFEELVVFWPWTRASVRSSKRTHPTSPASVADAPRRSPQAPATPAAGRSW